MFYLLGDSDDRVVDEITKKLEDVGSELDNHINRYLEFCDNPVIAERLTVIQAKNKNNDTVNALIKWRDSEKQDLLEGLFLIDELINPEFNKEWVLETVNKLKLDVWLALNHQMTSFEIVKEMNFVILEKNKFQGDTQDYYHISNSSLSQVLRKKSGNHILLSCIYLIISQKLNIPIVGVNLPQQFVIGYAKNEEWKMSEKLFPDEYLSSSVGGDILFYFNPYNKGIIFMAESVKDFLSQLKIPHNDNYFKSCSHFSIILRILRNMVNSYLKKGMEQKASEINVMIQRLNGE